MSVFICSSPANLCVSYIMTSQNEDAEELMRRIEKEEERVGFSDPDKQTFHLCIVNLGEWVNVIYFTRGDDLWCCFFKWFYLFY